MCRNIHFLFFVLQFGLDLIDYTRLCRTRARVCVYVHLRSTTFGVVQIRAHIYECTTRINHNHRINSIIGLIT